MTDKKHGFPGLTDAQVAESRLKNGSNLITPPAKAPLWKVFLAKFSDPLIIILLIAGVLSVGISCYEYWWLREGMQVFFEPIGIFVAIFLATGLAFFFEEQAGREFDLLNRVNDDEPVQVIRNGGAVSEIPKRDVVVGDIVVLNTGNDIPADGHLLEAVSMSVDESSLTGEPIASKTTDPDHFDHEATFPSNTVLRGTKVMEGHGLMEVSAVGDATENGKVFVAAQIDSSVKTPLNKQLDRLATLITRVAYGCAALIIVGRLVAYFSAAHASFDWIDFTTYALQTIMIAVTLMVVSIPEGLPMAVTLSLAYSMRRMLRSNNLVRKLHACETMGATTVICTDKTGTLTQNRMQVADAHFFGNPPSAILEEGIAVNSTARLEEAAPGELPRALGNPTEGALLLWLHSRGADYQALREKASIVREIPFSTERKYMATAVRSASGETILYVKGAPEIVFGMCSDTAGTTRAEIDTALLGYQQQAMRTLGFAYRILSPEEAEALSTDTPLSGLTFLGFVAISDPVRPDVPDAVREVTNAGIQIKIVTGDTTGTAKEIARRIGLWDDTSDSDANIITGAEFAALSDKELLSRVEDLKIIARARPMDKKRLVESLQTLGEVVAVTGDGTNDAPALKAAQVGLSMGDGTSVAKEASDITIIDNSFASIGRAVMWGRSLYRNIQRFILFQMTVNVVASLIVLCGAFMGTQSPLTVTQMLWVNLIMDTFAAIALASLPPSPDVMNDRPRSRTAFIIDRPMWAHIIGVGSAFFLILISFLYYLQHTCLESMTLFGHLPIGADHELSLPQISIFFSVFVFLQFWNMFNVKAFRSGRSAFHFKDCGGFLLIAALILIGQIVIVSIGGPLFSVTALSLADWLIIIGATSVVLWLGQAIHLISKK
ncbi:MAG: calcium-translocating P-type ATPase, PMCA-type [Muribaculaceae bacterium]|nr:calcium-translocating P-type ATPase, PMCA-type [Muribaculaceae bacterium]